MVFPPSQKLVRDVVTVGAAGGAITVTATGADIGELQLPLLTETV